MIKPILIETRIKYIGQINIKLNVCTAKNLTISQQININGVNCRIVLDTGSGSSYASEGLLDYLKINPTKKEIKTI